MSEAGSVPSFVPPLVISTNVGGIGLCWGSNLILTAIGVHLFSLSYGTSLITGQYLTVTVHGDEIVISFTELESVLPRMKKS